MMTVLAEYLRMNEKHECVRIDQMSFTLTRKPLRGVILSLSSGMKRPSNGPIIVVFKIRIVGENVIISSQRRICICVGNDSRTLR
jgi:hypothetical protein